MTAEIVKRTSWQGLLFGGSLGAFYGTLSVCFLPVAGTLWGLVIGSLVGLFLGFGNGLLVSLMANRIPRFFRLFAIGLFTFLCALTGFSFFSDVAGFSSGYQNLVIFTVFIPTLIATVIAIWIIGGITSIPTAA